MSQPLMISMSAACNRYGVDREKLSTLLNQRDILWFKLGRRILILRASADAYFASLAEAEAPAGNQYAFEF